ncbi:thioesterase [Nonomuraea longispora]|uniref:Thioesterase n=1 Tax=Nonomuraea longispora TaxID=1848320 RepID=A0A4R4NJK3_9ACTN|nr:alpha/beta fold hydrolase [Nonomuraea longispora]TDC07913.1 thioesterase [Nonomuraea longispora]
MTEPAGRWLRCYQPRQAVGCRLICLPHAGGSASAYRAWPALVGERIEVHIAQYPGREDRYAEPHVHDLPTAAARIADEVAPLTRGRYALFGHSMGGAIAYEVAVMLLQRGLPPPVHLFVSGREPPVHHRDGTVHSLDDEGIAAELIRLSPSNKELLAEPELAALVLPIIRSDYRLIESYRPGADVVLPVRITVLAGIDDGELSLAEARDWSRYTDREMRLRTFPGDHFFLNEHRRAVTGLIAETLSPIADPLPPAP